MIFNSGISPSKRRRVEDMAWKLANLARDIMNNPPPDMPALKTFVPKCPELEKLSSYHGEADDKFWEGFPVYKNMHGKSPYKLKAATLLQLAEGVGVADMETVQAVANDILFGCDLKVGDNCPPSRSTNAPSAKNNGYKVTDALASWVKSKIVCGPFDTCPNKAVVNGLMTRPKPNGSIRIIVNQSAPEKKSVNDFVDKKAYPSYMGGVKELLRAINYCGFKCEMAKADWNNAYKGCSSITH